VFAENSGYIQLNGNKNFEQALEDLNGFDRIWVVYVFHLNNNWKPKVSPPITGDKNKIGLFATRSPHRPNPIGMSCVNLRGIDGRKLFIENFDMLDQTPVLDIKPYIPECDSFPDSDTGWLPKSETQTIWSVAASEDTSAKMEWVKERTGLDLMNFSKVQLSRNPFDVKRKRIKKLDATQYVIACRTWSVVFEADNGNNAICLTDVLSNYSESDFLPPAGDKYGDKEIHKTFLTTFTESAHITSKANKY
jgi:tRNA-Thr(GGU) m(6)t(6)A37 methyltransferase TsaA